MIDVSAEQARLEKEIGHRYLRADLTKSLFNGEVVYEGDSR